MIDDKNIHKLAKKLVEVYPNKDDIKGFCSRAGLNIQTVSSGDSEFSYWKNILSFHNNRNSFTKLFDCLKKPEEANGSFETDRINIENAELIRRNNVVNAIRNNKCVLFLGPNVLRILNHGDVMPFNNYLCELLEHDLRMDLVYYDEQHKQQLAYIAQMYGETKNYVPGDLARKAANQFNYCCTNNLVQKNIFELLSRFNFPIIVNTNPDRLYTEILNEKKADSCISSYYDRTNSNSTESENDFVELNGKTFVYNIFGDFLNANSVLHTEREFLGFINSVIRGNPRVNRKVLNAIQDAEAYLFLGFDFEQWYFKVLFELFELKKQERNALSCNVADLTSMNREFFEDEFKIYFVSDNMESFLTRLERDIEGE